MGLLLLDGYTWDGFVAARGRAPAVNFRYRPALAERVYEYRRAIRPALAGRLRLDEVDRVRRLYVIAQAVLVGSLAGLDGAQLT